MHLAEMVYFAAIKKCGVNHNINVGKFDETYFIVAIALRAIIIIFRSLLKVAQSVYYSNLLRLTNNVRK